MLREDDVTNLPMRRFLATLALAIAVSNRPAAADQPSVAIIGRVEHPTHLTEAALEKLPVTELDSSFLTRHGREQGHFKGVLLWSLINTAGIVGDPGDKRDRFRRYLLVTGRDGYTVVVALGEIEPELEGRHVIIAYARNGQGLGPGHLRMIVPGDRGGGRAVKDLARIDLE
jgi:DMSO/TMAO reductase YedYZ molybdopterin-dependent catalytic subunit